MDAGVNYWHKGGGWVADAAAKYGREKQYIEICFDPTGSVEKDMERFKRGLGSLEYADFLKMHGTYDERSVEAFHKLKDAGLVRRLCASFHGYPPAIKALKAGELDAIQVGAAPQSLGEAQAVLAAAKEADAGVILMKTMNGGEKGFANAGFQAAVKPWLDRGLSAPQAAVATLLDCDGVTALTIATSSIDRLRSAVEAAKSAGAAGSAARLPQTELTAAFCTVCGACARACPNGVAVGDIMRFDMYSRAYGEERRAREGYAALPRPARAEGCGACGACSKACPFAVASPERVAEAGRRLA